MNNIEYVYEDIRRGKIRKGVAEMGIWVSLIGPILSIFREVKEFRSAVSAVI